MSLRAGSQQPKGETACNLPEQRMPLQTGFLFLSVAAQIVEFLAASPAGGKTRPGSARV
jgi:hypothetical protein